MNYEIERVPVTMGELFIKRIVKKSVLVLLTCTIIQQYAVHGQSSDPAERAHYLMGNYESVHVIAAVIKYTHKGELKEVSWERGHHATPVSSQSLARNVENVLRKNGIPIADSFDAERSILLMVEIWYMIEHFSERLNNKRPYDNLYHWLCTVTPRAIIPSGYGDLNIALGANWGNMGADMGYDEAIDARNDCIATVSHWFVPAWKKAQR